MNVLFISPHFPPQFWLFCAALRAEGATVLGIGDAAPSELPAHVHRVLHEYVAVPGLGDYHLGRYDDVHRAVSYLSWRHGRIDRVESLNEYWLALEARIREDFNIPGPRPAQLARHRSKTGMAQVFRAAGVPCTEGEPVEDAPQVRAFAARHGFPLVLKPDIGVGAARTWKVEDADALEAALPHVGAGYRVEVFDPGALTSYDGLVDRDGRVVFETSHVYSSGVMDIVNRGLDVFYYSRRDLPEALVEVGRRAVAGFGLREQFFHLEFFEGPSGLRALEINLRPPGGFTTDMMNYACDFDVYSLWARVLVGADLSGFSYQRRYHAAHASRRAGRRYRVPAEELRERLGERLVLEREVPWVLSGAMGNHLYLLRSPEEASMVEAIHLVIDPG